MHVALCALALVAAAPPGSADIAASTAAWQAQRIRRLTAEDGWLSLVALDWLKPGDNRAGSAAGNDVHFPSSSPARVGTFTLSGSAVSFRPARGVTVLRGGQPFGGGILQADDADPPDVLQLGSVRFLVHRVKDRTAIRIKDADAPSRRAFHGIPTYAPSADWRIQAGWEPAPPGTALAVPNVLGQVESMQSPGTAVFTLNGQAVRLAPVLEPGERRLFFIFADATNRTETYGAGRFLYADPPENGKITLDFNQAYNPPCAFSAYATCPLPPHQNRLAIRVDAGEKRLGTH